MSDDKKYYYLKLKDDFFNSEELIILESMPDGYLYSNILLKLYLCSLKNSGKLMFNDRIPYNSQMLSTITRHPVAVVEKAINIFIDIGLIEVMSNGVIYIMDIQNFIGKSSTEADRKRNYRLKIESEKMLLSGQTSDKCPDKNPPEKEREKEKEIEREPEKDFSSSLPPAIDEIKQAFEKSFHPIFKATELDALSAYIDDYGRMGVLKAIETASKRKSLNKATLSPRYLLPILQQLTQEKSEAPANAQPPVFADLSTEQQKARMRAEDEARMKKIQEADEYGVYGGLTQ